MELIVTASGVKHCLGPNFIYYPMTYCFKGVKLKNEKNYIKKATLLINFISVQLRLVRIYLQMSISIEKTNEVW